jgi:hypothetical protein
MERSRLFSGWIVLTLAALLIIPSAVKPAGVLAQQTGQAIRVPMRAQNGSGQDGYVTLTAAGQDTLVQVQVAPGGAGVPQPIHFHDGSCANLNPVPKINLNPVMNGASETMVNTPLAELANGRNALNIHRSPQEPAVYTSCGDVPNLQAIGPLPPPPGTVPSASTFATPQFGSAVSTSWPPVFSGELQVTVGNNTAVVGLVGNRTLDSHAFVDVRWAVPSQVTFVDSAANTIGQNRGKFEGLSVTLNQVGWINHYVRAGQVQGPFYVIVTNSGRAFQSWSWLWFTTAGQGVNHQNGNYVSTGVTAGDSPFTWSGEFASASGASGSTGVPLAGPPR